MGAPAPPRAVKKNFFRPNLQEKCVSAPPQDTKCTPQPEQESIFRSFCWVVKKCTPADNFLATPMAVTVLSVEVSVNGFDECYSRAVELGVPWSPRFDSESKSLI